MLCICGRVVVFGCIFVTSIYAVSCPKGSFISPSGCQPCPEGEYSDSVNSTKCSKCDLCRGKHNRLTQPCNSTSNTKCSCEPGYFWDVFLFCLKCHRCKRGHGVVKNCTSLRNTVCGVCEHGTNYSNKKDFSPCKPCTTCPHGYWVEKKCNKKNDTVCRKDTDMNGSKNDRNRGRSSGAIQQGNPDTKLPDDNHTPSPTNNSTNATAKPHQPSQQKVLEPQPNTGNDSELVIALAVLSGVAFLVMLIAMALLLRNKCTRKSAKHTDEAEKVEDSSNSVSEVEGARENPYTSLPLIGARQGPRETGPTSRPTDECDSSQPPGQDAGSLTNRCLCYLSHGMSTSTSRIYQSAQRRYIAFCQTEGRTTPNGSSLPADEQTLMRFCTMLASRMNPYASIKVYLSAVRALHIDSGLRDPLDNCHQLEYLVKGIKQVEGSSRLRHLPVTIEVMRIIRQFLDFSNQDNVMVWAACCLGFFGFARTSEFTVNSSFDSDTHMTYKDVKTESAFDSTFLKVHVKCSRMEPFRKDCDVYVGQGEASMCPLQAINKYLQARGSMSGPLFLHRDGTPLSRQKLSSTVKDILQSAGFLGAYSGYSFRIGAAETAASRGVPGHLITTLGRRSCDAYEAYSRTPVSSILRVTKQMLLQVRIARHSSGYGIEFPSPSTKILGQ